MMRWSFVTDRDDRFDKGGIVDDASGEGVCHFGRCQDVDGWGYPPVGRDRELMVAAPELADTLAESLVYIEECSRRGVVPNAYGDGLAAARALLRRVGR